MSLHFSLLHKYIAKELLTIGIEGSFTLERNTIVFANEKDKFIYELNGGDKVLLNKYRESFYRNLIHRL